MTKLIRDCAKRIGNVPYEIWSTKGEWPATIKQRIWLADRWQVVDSYKSLRHVFPLLSKICNLDELAVLTKKLCGIESINYFDGDTPLQLQEFLGIRFRLPVQTKERLEFTINSRSDQMIYRWVFTCEGTCFEEEVGIGFDSYSKLRDEMSNS